MPRNERFSLPIPRILHDRSLRLFSVRIADLFRNYLEYFLLLLYCPIHIRFRQRMSCLHISHLPASGTDLIYCCLPCYLNYCRHHCLNFLPEHNYPQGNQAQRLLKSQLSAHLLQPVLHKHPHRLPPALHIL